MAKIYERSPGNWYIRYQLDGRERRLRVGSTKSQALAALRDFERRRALRDLTLPELPKTVRPQKVLFEDLCLKYLDQSMVEKSDKTRKAEEDRIKYKFLPMFQNRFVDEISMDEIQSWRESRLASGISPSTVYTDLKILKTIFSRAKVWGLFVGDDPVGKLPRVIKRDPYYPTIDEIERYLTCCPPYYFPIAAFLIFTGMRIGELLGLKWNDIDLKRNVIRVRPEASLKNERGRDIPINPQLLDVIEGLTRTHDLVFPSKTGGVKQNVRTGHVIARKSAGLSKLRIHDLRHAFITLLIQAGYDPGSVSALAGHGSLKITMEIYHHLHQERARTVINGIPIRLPKNVTGIKTGSGDSTEVASS